MKLYIVATPIGNLDDITFRAVETLTSSDLILCESTSNSQALFKKYNINAPTKVFYSNTNENYLNKLLSDLIEKANTDYKVSLISDAGTPAISDPGVLLIEKLKSIDGIDIIPIPGVSALTTLYSVSGLSGNNFVFMGFMPHKKGRQTFIDDIANSDKTVIFYESVHRFLKTLEALNSVISIQREVIIGRELTKYYEEIKRGGINNIYNYYKENEDKVRGEFVIIVEGNKN